jgi:hypothetical protein
MRVSYWGILGGRRGSGTHAPVSSPARKSLVSIRLSRRSVLTRSPDFRGIKKGRNHHIVQAQIDELPMDSKPTRAGLIEEKQSSLFGFDRVTEFEEEGWIKM